MNDAQYYFDVLADLTKDAGDISAEWNGEDPGIAEERANVAELIIAKAEELTELISTL